jgi:hypothetical protein
VGAWQSGFQRMDIRGRVTKDMIWPPVGSVGGNSLSVYLLDGPFVGELSDGPMLHIFCNFVSKAVLECRLHRWVGFRQVCNNVMGRVMGLHGVCKKLPTLHLQVLLHREHLALIVEMLECCSLMAACNHTKGGILRPSEYS